MRDNKRPSGRHIWVVLFWQSPVTKRFKSLRKLWCSLLCCVEPTEQNTPAWYWRVFFQQEHLSNVLTVSEKCRVHHKWKLFHINNYIKEYDTERVVLVNFCSLQPHTYSQRHSSTTKKNHAKRTAHQNCAIQLLLVVSKRFLQGASIHAIYVQAWGLQIIEIFFSNQIIR